MKKSWFVTTLLLPVLVLASSGMAQEKCSVQTVIGVYSLSCSGWINLVPGNPLGPYLPFAVQARFVNELLPDRTLVSNSLDGVLESLGGDQVTRTYSSTAVTINPNCTGSVTYHVAEENLDITFSLLVLDEGKEGRAFGIQNGLVSTCNLRLMNRNTN